MVRPRTNDAAVEAFCPKTRLRFLYADVSATARHLAKAHGDSPAAAAILGGDRIERRSERILIALASWRCDVLNLKVTERMYRKLLILRVDYAFLRLEENRAVWLRLVGRMPLCKLAEEPFIVLFENRELDNRQTRQTRRESADLESVASFCNKREGVAVTEEPRAAAINRHVLKPLKIDDDLLHSGGAAHRSEKHILRALFVEVILAVGKPQRVAVAKPRQRRSHSRRSVPGTWLDLNHRRMGRNHKAEHERKSRHGTENPFHCIPFT